MKLIQLPLNTYVSMKARARAGNVSSTAWNMCIHDAARPQENSRCGGGARNLTIFSLFATLMIAFCDIKSMPLFRCHWRRFSSGIAHVLCVCASSRRPATVKCPRTRWRGSVIGHNWYFSSWKTLGMTDWTLSTDMIRIHDTTLIGAFPNGIKGQERQGLGCRPDFVVTSWPGWMKCD
jgi:hypothetical protein